MHKSEESRGANTLGILIVNSGSPDSPELVDVRRFFKRFMSDPRITRINPIVWKPILNLLVLPTRTKALAEKYQAIWTKNGSPLINYSKQLVRKMESNLHGVLGKPFRLNMAMLYGDPDIEDVLDEFYSQRINTFLVLPLFPQYSTASTAPVQDRVEKWKNLRDPVLKVFIVLSYLDNSAYLDAIVQSVSRYWDAHGRGERLLFSFHGVPISFIKSGCPYFAQCKRTVDLVVDRLGLSDAQWSLSFQSRFGRQRWLQPYTEDVLKEWAQEGVKNVDIICPGFSIDSLETLYEVKIELKEKFIRAGGEKLNYIPALDGSDLHVKVLTSVILGKLHNL